MNAQETKLQFLLEGTKQYVIPLFQREYSWGQSQWKTLFNDLLELYNEPNPKDHFMGSIVTMPVFSRPEGVAKYSVIDGQQRLTTFFIILSVIRDCAKEIGGKLPDIVNELYLFNKFSEGNDYYKLLPTQGDRKNFFKTMSGSQNGTEDNLNQMSKAYNYFSKQIKIKKIDVEKLLKTLTNSLLIVSITLNKDDNPYRIFESLNGTGLPLAESDLIRNYFFMRIHINDQENVHKNLWKPMQVSFDNFDKENEKGKTLSDFIRHFLIKDWGQIKEKEVYSSLKEIADRKSDDEIILYLTDIYDCSRHYLKLLNPDLEGNSKIRERIKRLNRLDVTTSYCFILNLYALYSHKKISADDFSELLSIVENFVIRRFICGVPANQYNKIFPTLFRSINKDNIVKSLMEQLKDKNYPKNTKFKTQLLTLALYGRGKDNKVKLILESLESWHGHKEQIEFEKLQIEHIMPQTLTDEWQKHLGDNWENTYDNYVHSIGNLTLTGYNPELSNLPYRLKKKEYKNSHLELNKYFEYIDTWNEEQIINRASELAECALKTWPSFHSNESENDITNIIVSDVTGKKPVSLFMLNEKFQVSTWKEVLIKTLENTYILDEQVFFILNQEYPNRINPNKDKLRVPYDFKNGYFVEVNQSAESIKKFCLQIINRFELSEEDWKVETI
ncbi:DUF262 domain-containing protein [Clostridium tagluense]|uniref:DUF262 domain-containing protein n=1 Tax=Clostridium tagluense TaxID=360422 RepID=A0A401UNJ0_9CLOT|nr:DUF262 domain-containing protein [Clostridium tagluense]GCD11090.1 hypothetical protein Ctaglu_27130 [Clostridium tagluense]